MKPIMTKSQLERKDVVCHNKREESCTVMTVPWCFVEGKTCKRYNRMFNRRNI